MARTRLRKAMRVTHHWISLIVLITGGSLSVTGILLLLKKDIDWLQPPVVTATSSDMSDARIDALFGAASRAAPHPLRWEDIDRIDVRPSDGIAKVITESASEYQVDLHTLEVLSIGSRGADVVEKIHDGTFFGSGVKYFLMIPAGVTLFILWVSGIYLFFVGQAQKRRNRLRRTERRN